MGVKDFLGRLGSYMLFVFFLYVINFGFSFFKFVFIIGF